MKKLFFAVIAVFLFAQTNLLAQKKNVAVTTMYIDKYIDASSLSGDAAMVATIATLAKDERFDLTSVLNDFHDKFFKDYVKEFNFNILDEKVVLENPDYKSYESKWGEDDQKGDDWLDGYIPYEGYKVLYRGGLKKESRNHMRMLEIFDKEADGVMMIDINYSFVPKVGVGGMGTAGIAAHLHMTLYNKEGKKVFNFHEIGTSKKTVGMVAGIPVMKIEKIKPLCENATEKLMADLYKKLPKLMKKVDKKFM
ncbi:MAG: hypothetical protein MRY83_11500 [Flavobacteriales bacterium]|nr:hypothetical protein [Flavobacteriales bacterium]